MKSSTHSLKTATEKEKKKKLAEERGFKRGLEYCSRLLIILTSATRFLFIFRETACCCC